MLFFSFFKTLVDQEVIVELKNDIEIKGTLKSVDQFLNLKLDNISTVNETKYPHLKAVKNLFVRGSTVRYVHLSASSVDCTLLQDASRRGMYIDRIPEAYTNYNRGLGAGRQIEGSHGVQFLHVYYGCVPINQKLIEAAVLHPERAVEGREDAQKIPKKPSLH